LRRVFASSLIPLLGIAATLIVAAATTQFPLWGAAVGIVLSIPLVGVAEYYITYKPLLSYKDRQLSTFFSDFLRMIERDVEWAAHGDVNVRANIMRPASSGWSDDPTFTVTFYTEESEYRGDELELEFEIGQGCVGNAYQDNDQKVAISADHVDTWSPGWNTTSTQDRATEHLNTIIGTPIYRPTDEEKDSPVAILIVDSEDHFREFVDLNEGQDLSDIEFKQTEVAKISATHASNCGILL